MFEYNFGFYLNQLVKKTNKDILRIGYQHGIFSSNLLWIELLKELKSKKYFQTKSFILVKFLGTRTQIFSQMLKRNIEKKYFRYL